MSSGSSRWCCELLLSRQVWVSSETKGASPRKSHKIEGAQGTALLGSRASWPDAQDCGGHSGRKGTRMSSRSSQGAGGRLWLQPQPGVKQEKGLKPGLCAVVGDSEATQDTQALCFSLLRCELASLEG